MASQITHEIIPMPHPMISGSTRVRIITMTDSTTSRIRRPTPFFACQWISGSSFFVRYGIRASRPRYESTIINVRSELGLIPLGPPIPPGGGGGGGGGVYDPPPGGGGVAGGTVGGGISLISSPCQSLERSDSNRFR